LFAAWVLPGGRNVIRPAVERPKNPPILSGS
jgi:hypothetical protein